jgi:hypothetical protein
MVDAKRDDIRHFIWLILLKMKVWDDIRHFIWLILLRCELGMPSSEKVFVRVLVE